ncbi:hypothetical protein RU639_001285 [Aspergillus parasiticus]
MYCNSMIVALYLLALAAGQGIPLPTPEKLVTADLHQYCADLGIKDVAIPNNPTPQPYLHGRCDKCVGKQCVKRYTQLAVSSCIGWTRADVGSIVPQMDGNAPLHGRCIQWEYHRKGWDTYLISTFCAVPGEYGRGNDQFKTISTPGLIKVDTTTGKIGCFGKWGS